MTHSAKLKVISESPKAWSVVIEHGGVFVSIGMIAKLTRPRKGWAARSWRNGMYQDFSTKSAALKAVTEAEAI